MDYQAFFKLTYGLYILTSKHGSRLNGHISNTVFQITADPPRMAVASHVDNLTTDYIRESGVFAVSVLQQDVDLEFMGPWGFKSGKEVDKFITIKYRIGKTGAPIILDETIAYFECKVENEIRIGTHVIFTGLVVDIGILNDEAEPLTYAYYRKVIKGVSPEKSPTYIDPDKLEHFSEDEDEPEHSKKLEQITDKKDKDWRKYRCTVCGYIYDPEDGDPHTGISPGTAFEDIPDDWTCPICGVAKADFIPMD